MTRSIAALFGPSQILIKDYPSLLSLPSGDGGQEVKEELGEKGGKGKCEHVGEIRENLMAYYEAVFFYCINSLCISIIDVTVSKTFFTHAYKWSE